MTWINALFNTFLVLIVKIIMFPEKVMISNSVYHELLHSVASYLDLLYVLLTHFLEANYKKGFTGSKKYSL